MTQRPRDPLSGCRRLLIDGSNQRGHSADPAPEEPFVRSLAGLFPATLELIVVFDTDPPIGAATVRTVGRVTVVHARAGGGDDAIVARVSAAPSGSLVVTDDLDLRRRVSNLGARVERNQWLSDQRQHGRLVAPSVGRRMARSPLIPDAAGDDADLERDNWQPGRGATAKRGPSRRSPKRRRSTYW